MIRIYIQSEGINQDFGVYDSPDDRKIRKTNDFER